MLPTCQECGCESTNLQSRAVRFETGESGVLRLCLVCVVMFDAVCTAHLIAAQREYLEENARRAAVKKALLREV